MEENQALEASKKPPPPKYCRVCGDRAVGFNFNAISCESCKSFFRRNARRQENMVRCPYESKCDITLETRRHCKRCRLNKCFEVTWHITILLSSLTYRLACAKTCCHQRIACTRPPWTISPDAAESAALSNRRIARRRQAHHRLLTLQWSTIAPRQRSALV